MFIYDLDIFIIRYLFVLLIQAEDIYHATYRLLQQKPINYIAHHTLGLPIQAFLLMLAISLKGNLHPRGSGEIGMLIVVEGLCPVLLTLPYSSLLTNGSAASCETVLPLAISLDQQVFI